MAACDAVSLTYATVCSGIEAVSLAWESLGFKPVFFSENAEFPSAVLAHHWPDVPNLGDMTSIDGAAWRGRINILWGSTPCQAFSVAGRREGTADPRGALTVHFANLVDEIEPDFICWENVKGVLSDANNAFGCLLGALAGEDEALVPPGGKWSHAGYVLGPKRTITWRLFDAQYSGVAQRRERVFLVACPRDGADPREILFESEGVRRDNPPCRPSKKNSSVTPDEGADASSEAVFYQCHGNNVGPIGTLRAGNGNTAGGVPFVAYTIAMRGRDGGSQVEVGGEFANCLRASQGGGDKSYVLIDAATPVVRQLTPLECERLMGMPDNHTHVDYRKKPAADGVRYHAIGNSIAVPDVRWIGQRIASSYQDVVTQ